MQNHSPLPRPTHSPAVHLTFPPVRSRAGRTFPPHSTRATQFTGAIRRRRENRSRRADCEGLSFFRHSALYNSPRRSPIVKSPFDLSWYESSIYQLISDNTISRHVAKCLFSTSQRYSTLFHSPTRFYNLPQFVNTGDESPLFPSKILGIAHQLSVGTKLDRQLDRYPWYI